MHFSNNANRPADCQDKLYKLRLIYDNLVNKFKSLYNLGEHISIDEAMLNWRGRLGFKVYMKSKPTKHGIKSYVLADSKSSYCWNLCIYKRDKKTLLETVTELLTPQCYNLYHSLYMDNFYNSIALSENLLEKKIHTVGTLRGNRGEPQELRRGQLNRLQQHEVVAFDNGKVVVLAWKDKRVVKALTTKHDASVCSITRRQRGGNRDVEVISKPVAITDYNDHMAGVDKMDQMISYYPCTRKSMKWTTKVFCYLMEISLHNSFILYKSKTVQNKFDSYFKFRLQLIQELCQQESQPAFPDSDVTTPRKAPRHDPPGRLIGGFSKHRLEIFPTTSSSRIPRRDCRLCRLKGVRKSVQYFCKECGVALCPAPCFCSYHTENQLV